MKSRTLTLIGGPTASGKTDFAVELAKTLNAEIINADARQVYKHMQIGTAMPSSEEMQGIPHHLMGFLDPKESINAAMFCRFADEIIAELWSKDKNVVIVGGTGLYLKALIWGLTDTPAGDKKIREELQGRFEKGEDLHALLQTIDAPSAKQIHPNDSLRTIRALEIYYQTGKTKSEHVAEHQFKEARYKAKYFVINPERSPLYVKIEKRVDLMMKMGLLEEVKSLLEQGYSFDDPGLQTIGYKQFQPYFEEGKSLAECVQLIKRDSKRYAKRQYIWNKKIKDAIFIPPSQGSYKTEIPSLIEKYF